ncbi:uncharacterized protein IL334_004337 [Kwoniella shivajii]|uniref:Uncharacterized protein n=1 Tax=Kwoniella shivajii TaxID=564305 RepID=A0ABZ1D0F9_9TREE|nr:hypothetical protein IL334_004337 [Kwoniella shivajii]
MSYNQSRRSGTPPSEWTYYLGHYGDRIDIPPEASMPPEAESEASTVTANSPHPFSCEASEAPREPEPSIPVHVSSSSTNLDRFSLEDATKLAKDINTNQLVSLESYISSGINPCQSSRHQDKHRPYKPLRHLHSSLYSKVGKPWLKDGCASSEICRKHLVKTHMIWETEAEKLKQIYEDHKIKLANMGRSDGAGSTNS